MSMRPGWPLTLVMLVLCGIFIQLGLWQLDRATQKRAAWAAYQEQVAAPALVWADEPPSLLEAQRLLVRGQWQPELGFWLDNRSHAGKAGMQRIDFLQLANGTLLAVNRGWLAHRADRQLPAQIPDLPVLDAGVLGQVHVPQRQGFRLGEAASGALRLYLDLESIARARGIQVQPVVLQQLSDTPDGLLRAWSDPKPEEGMHLAYAVQWFGFAATLLLLWLWVGWRRAHGHDS